MTHRLGRSVWLVALAVVALLVATAGRYGFHGDEFYFVVTGRHLQLAAPDNGMLVPYLAAGWYALVGGHLLAFRVLPALAAGGYVLVGAAVAREVGGDRRSQLAAAAAVALSVVTLALGHLFETTTFDMLLTAIALWMLIRALRADPARLRPWIAVGVLTGLALEVKVLAALVLSCCLLGVLIMGPRRPLRTVGPWLAVLVALVLAAPNLGWQAAHGFPMSTVARDIAAGGSTSSTSRAALLPVTLLEVGPVISIVLVVGLVALLRRELRRTEGWLAVALLIFVAVMLATGGKAYYPAGFYPAVLAFGAPRVLDWVRRAGWRRILAGVLMVISVVATSVLSLPLARPGSALYRVALGPNPDLASEIGWPGYVDTIERVTAAVTPADRPHTIVLARYYEEAAPLALAGGPDQLAVYSGHNGFWYWGPPPDGATDAVVVGDYPTAQLDRWYAHCTLRTRVQTPTGIENDLTGDPVRWCTGRRLPWATLWPQVQLLG